MKYFLTGLLSMLTLFCAAQQQTYDLVTYTPPKGWKKEEKVDIASYVIINQKTKTWCRIAIIKSTASKGSIDSDFDSEWNEFAVKQYNVSGQPQLSEVQEADGWKIKAGGGAFSHNNADALVMITTFSGFDRCVSIVSTTNSQDHVEDIQAFLGSVHLEKPAINTVTPGQTQHTDNFAFHTTNFNEGWTSTIHEDYVLTTKGNIKVYLSYVEKFNISDYSGNGKQVRFHYWETFVSKYFVTGETKYDQGGVLSDFSQDFMEGPATDRQTNESRYVALLVRIIPYTGTLSLIIVSAPDAQSFRAQFPRADTKFDNDLAPMYGFNKFAVGKNDLIGKWVTGGNGASVSYYSTVSGNYAGSTAVATSDVFNFGEGGKYTSTHKGASGWVGAMNTYQQEYKGSYTVTEWEVIATNRWDGKTEEFDAWFEIVRGGRVLHLVNRSNDLNLFKEK